MLRKIRSSTSMREAIRVQKKVRIQRKISQRDISKVARLVVYRSNKFLYAQIINDAKAHTIAQANTGEETFKNGSKKNLDAAKKLGTLIGERAKAEKVSVVVFDRNGYDYHGRIKAIAEGAREAGLKF